MAARAANRRGLGSRAGNALLTVAAAGGLLCIVLVPLAFVFHVTLIMFKTGSMSPTIPAGSLAVVRQIPAADIHVGDIVTVDRSPAPPITHRVTSVSPAPGGARLITLRGDANPADDPAPYLVHSVRLVVFSVPRLAYAVRAASDPLVMGAITVGAAALVTWAFWPRGTEDHRARHGRPRRAGAARALADKVAR
jgi:signal peptidase I